MPSYFSFRALAFASLALVAATGCKKDEPAAAAASAKPAAVAPAATSAAPVAAKPAAKPAAVKSVPTEKLAHPIPTDWVEINEEKRGFSFSMPKGSTAHAEDKNGVAAYIGILPAPNDKVAVMVVAYKDAKKTLDDLAKEGEEALTKGFGETNPKILKTLEISPDYRLVELTTEDAKDKSVSHWKILCGTDVTDNYVMIVGTPASELKANEPTMDEVWGSFDMRSGGASGESGTPTEEHH
jgi:hypothetical protein